MDLGEKKRKAGKIKILLLKTVDSYHINALN